MYITICTAVERGCANLKIIIRNTSEIPIYEQIKEQVKAAVYSGELAEGSMLPSIRRLARDLKISVITVKRAYSDLEEEGFVTNVQGKGCFAKSKNNEDLRAQALLKIGDGLTRAAKIAKEAQISEGELYSMLEIALKEEGAVAKCTDRTKNKKIDMYIPL